MGYCYIGSTDHRGTLKYPGRTATLEPAEGEVCVSPHIQLSFPSGSSTWAILVILNYAGFIQPFKVKAIYIYIYGVSCNWIVEYVCMSNGKKNPFF